MPKLIKPPLETLKKTFNINDDVVVIDHLTKNINDYQAKLVSHSKLWLEFALSISNEANVEPQHYPYGYFCRLVYEALDCNVLDEAYMFDLKQLAKKSGRILEFTYLLNHLSKKNDNEHAWLSTEMVYQVFFHALQLNDKKFGPKAFEVLCKELQIQVCLLDLAHLKKLQTLANLNNRLPYFEFLLDVYEIMTRDLNVLEPLEPPKPSIFAERAKENANKRPFEFPSSGSEWDSEEEPPKRHKSQA